MHQGPPDRVAPPPSPDAPPVKAVGITLMPGPVRLIALLIIAVPFAVLFLLALTAGGKEDDARLDRGTRRPGAVGAVDRYPAVERTSRPMPTYPTTVRTGWPAPSGPAATYPTPSVPGTATPTATPTGTPSPDGRDGPAATVRTAYTAINSGNYRTAYALGLAPAGQSYEDFAAGYSNTYYVTVTIVGVQADTVTVRLLATHKDNTRDAYAGTYTVTDGVITGSQLRPTN